MVDYSRKEEALGVLQGMEFEKGSPIFAMTISSREVSYEDVKNEMLNETRAGEAYYKVLIEVIEKSGMDFSKEKVIDFIREHADEGTLEKNIIIMGPDKHLSPQGIINEIKNGTELGEELYQCYVATLYTIERKKREAEAT
jgi:hypothetical protein